MSNLDRRQGELRTVTMAEMVATALRDQILDGRLVDGERLPRQDVLAASFDISGPSVREGLRILEAEGLITVRRGKFGGAFVHSPKPGNAAYMLAVVLESQRVPLHEIGSALRDLEPVCAGRCAARQDRSAEVLPRLEKLHREMVTYDGDDYRDNIRLGLEFHEALVTGSGSITLITMIGALESIWFAHAEAWVAANLGAADVLPGSEYAATRNHEHGLLLERIQDGDVDGATAVARHHLDRSRLHTARDDVENQVVKASLLGARKA